MERDSPDLGPFDGLLGPETTARSLFDQEGLSPTALERYACCPFRYFMEKVLCVKPVRLLRQDSVPALTMGTLVHETLRRSYEQVTASHWPVETPTRRRFRSSFRTRRPRYLPGMQPPKGRAICGSGHLHRTGLLALVRWRSRGGTKKISIHWLSAACVCNEGGRLTAARSMRTSDPGQAGPARCARRSARSSYCGLQIQAGAEMASQDRNLLVAALRGSSFNSA